jgi:Spy/CpxP family protein refolding chaperone
MTRVSNRIALAGVAGLIALGVTASLVASAQNTNQDPGSFSQRRMGPPPNGLMGRGGWLGPGPGGPLGLLRMLGPRLNLTDAQRDQLKSIANAHQDEWKALADRARAAHQALADAVTADTVDEGLIRAKAADAAAVEADIAVASAHAHAEAWQILTPEQQAQARQFRTEMQNRMKERRGAFVQRLQRFFADRSAR